METIETLAMALDPALHERLARIETHQEHQFQLLGKIDQKLDKQDEKLDAQDARLRGIEKKTAVHASVVGGLVSVGVSLIAAKLTGKA